MVPSSPASRPSPSGGLRPALTPAPGGTHWPSSRAAAKFKINPAKRSLYGSRGLPAEIAIEQGETRYEGITWTTRSQIAANQLIPLPEPARRGLINLADDLIATTNRAVAAAAPLHPSDVTRSTRSGHQAHRGRSAETLQIARPHDPAPRGPHR
jgi:hypothetical protein